MVSGVFSIPLELKRSSAVRRSSGAVNEWVLREYISDGDNALVQAVATSLVETPPRYCPILIYGPSGTGKSLLAHGLMGCWRKNNPRMRVLFMTGADFTRRYANAVETDDLPDFRAKLRQASLLVLDGLQAVAEKSAAQRELIGTLDAAPQREQHVLVTSLQLPAEMSDLLPGLASRLSAGLTVPLMPPGVEARHVILQRLAESRDLHLTDDAVRLLVEGFPGRPHFLQTVPQLDQALKQLGESGTAGQAAIDEQQVREFLNQETPTRRATLRTIASQVSKHFEIKTSDLRGATRRQQIVRARGIAMFLARQLTDKSLQQVGQFFGNRDHSTVLHACRTTEERLESDRSLQETVHSLTQRICGT